MLLALAVAAIPAAVVLSPQERPISAAELSAAHLSAGQHSPRPLHAGWRVDHLRRSLGRLSDGDLHGAPRRDGVAPLRRQERGRPRCLVEGGSGDSAQEEGSQEHGRAVGLSPSFLLRAGRSGSSSKTSYGADWSPDGTQLAVCAIRERRDPARVPDRSSSVQVEEHLILRPMRVSGSGKQVAFVEFTPQGQRPPDRRLFGEGDDPAPCRLRAVHRRARLATG